MELVFPFDFRDIFDLVPDTGPLPSSVLVDRAPDVGDNVSFLGRHIGPVLRNSFSPGATSDMGPLLILNFVTTIV